MTYKEVKYGLGNVSSPILSFFIPLKFINNDLKFNIWLLVASKVALNTSKYFPFKLEYEVK